MIRTKVISNLLVIDEAVQGLNNVGSVRPIMVLGVPEYTLPIYTYNETKDVHAHHIATSYVLDKDCIACTL